LKNDDEWEHEISTIERVSQDANSSLSFAQQRLWFLDQLEPDSSTYNIPSAMRLQGNLNVPALEQTLNEIVRRHEALRTIFPAVGGEPVQLVTPATSLNLPLIDISAMPHDGREAEAHRLANEEAQRPFNLATGPLLRVTLLRLAEEEHITLFTMHHIISDGWSMGVLVNEVIALYRSYLAGEPSPLAELPIQYADYAHWQREWLQGEVLERQLAYWRDQLADVPAVSELPTDRPRPAVQTFRGASESFTLAPRLSQSLRELSRREGATLYMTLMAAFQTLLYRYTGQGDIIVGSPIAGRNRAETEALVGFFVNTLVLRSRIAPGNTFTELLQQVREAALGAYTHQDIPMEKLVEELQPERNTSHTPLFQVTCAMQNAPMETLELSGLVLSEIANLVQPAKYDLSLSFGESDQVIYGTMVYNVDLFDDTTITRMIEHLETLLQAVVADPHLPLSELPLLPDAERRRLLFDFNDTSAPYPRHSSIHHLFEEQAARTPDAVALVSGDEQLSYAELNGRANQLARHLRGLGVGSESLVGICLERGVEMVTALLATLKAGGAYLPLDPAYPLERLSFMMEDAGIGVLLTKEAIGEELPSQWVHVINVDSEWEQVALESAENVESEVGGDNLAYVIYTSGSTGIPKGVYVTHRNLLHSTSARLAYYEEAVKSFLLLSSFAFDSSVAGIFWTLSQGGTLLLPEKGAERDPLELGRLIAEHSVTHALSLPSLYAVLLRQLEAAQLASLRTVIVAGESCPKELVEQHHRLLPDAALFNEYGPTEGTVWSTVHACRPGERSMQVSIGRPINNVQIYLVNSHFQPVPIGVVGELHIGGEGVARGYLNRPEATAERFLPNPFSDQPGARLYKTGDIGRLLPDGGIEFLGRTDQQVKIRGYRIELGEVETVLAGHPDVGECVAIVREDVAGDKRLVVYLTGMDDGQNPSGAELRDYVKEKLPEYMVPNAFVVLPELPLTANGKVDRRRLPAPEQAREQSESLYAAPRTPIEELLSGIWAEVLGVGMLSVHENFFELGGHSLLATQVMSRVREMCHVEMPLRALFEAPTVAGLAVCVEAEIQGQQGAEVPPITRAGAVDELPLSLAQQRLWFLNQMEPEKSVYNLPSVVRLEGRLDVGVMEQTLTEIVRRHEALRTVFPAVNGEPVQLINAAQPFTLAVEDISALGEAERDSEARRLAAEEAARPFDLTSGPLLRATLLKLGEEEHIVLFTMHHIISDGWSMGVLVNEVAALYRAFLAGEPSPLAELPIQYADYAYWQRQWLRGEVLERQISYWREQLSGAPALLELPTDRPRPAVQSYRGARDSLTVSAEVSQGLKELSRREGVTLYMTLLAAFQTLLYRYSGQPDIVVGSPVAGRNRSETETLIGFFINTLAMRSRINPPDTFRDLLRQVRETTLGAYAHQDLPLDVLIKELQPVRSLSHQPLFQVSLSLQNTPGEELELPGLALSPVASEIRSVPFDLILNLREFDQSLLGVLDYNIDLFDAPTITRMIEHLKLLLGSIVAEADATVEALCATLAEADRQQQIIRERELENASLSKLKNARRRRVRES
jgi:amino acid adenylation domain-containing protein